MSKDAAMEWEKVTRPPVLYHASPHDVGAFIKPHLNATSINHNERRSLVFAGPDLHAAHAYSLKTDGCIMIQWLRQNDSPTELFYLHQSRERFYEQNPQGFIYKVDPQYFEPVISHDGRHVHEWISKTSVPVKPEETIRTEGIDAAMRKNIQFFFLARNPNQEEQKKINNPTIDNYADLIKTGVILWENQIRNISPSPSLSWLLGEHHRQHVNGYHLPNA